MNDLKPQKAPKIIYSAEEEDWLVGNALIYSPIIENKKTDGPTNRDKDQAWEKITSAFNVAPPGEERSLKSLRENYTKIKQSLKEREVLSKEKEKEKDLPPLSEAMQQLADLLASSPSEVSGGGDCSTANTAAALKNSSSAGQMENISAEEIIEDKKVLKGEQLRDRQCPRSEATVRPVQSENFPKKKRRALNGDAVAGCSSKREKPPQCTKPLNDEKRRRKMPTRENPYSKQKMYEEMHKHLVQKHKIEMQILSTERERYQCERERAGLELKRIAAQIERADVDRKRAGIELLRSKHQLRYDMEIHQVRLATLQNQTTSTESILLAVPTTVKEELQ